MRPARARAGVRARGHTGGEFAWTFSLRHGGAARTVQQHSAEIIPTVIPRKSTPSTARPRSLGSETGMRRAQSLTAGPPARATRSCRRATDPHPPHAERVEQGEAAAGLVPVRDSKLSHGPILTVTTPVRTSFVTALKDAHARRTS
ncbi:DUF397 domain-containing protein [Streptomyces sp. NPDC056309]|uniref:DUF397 domain-containing protein n=1 Tax=unclassified Streptomyces TaxID=2593676 RepID=UPI0035DEDBB2